MSILSRVRPLRVEEVRQLLASSTGAGPRISVYLTRPQNPGFDDLRQGRDRRRELVRTIERRLLRAGRSHGEIGERVDTLRFFLRPRSGDAARWHGTRAVFMGGNAARAFDLALSTASLTSVAHEYVLVPLLRALHHDRPWRLLALAPPRASAWEGRLDGLREVELDGLSGPAAGTLPPERFLPAVHRAATELWRDRADPLVVVADRGVQHGLHELGPLPGSAAAGVIARPDELAPGELHGRGLAAALAQTAREDGEHLRALLAGPRERWERGSPEALRPAAEAGRIERLWLVRRSRHDRRQDGVDQLAARVLREGGEVPVLDPDEAGVPAELVAELRW